MLAVDSNKYNLKNATLFLTQLKIKYAKTSNHQVNMNSNNQHEKTFTDINEQQEDSITTYNHLHQSYNTNQIRQTNSQTQNYLNSQPGNHQKLIESIRQNKSSEQGNKLDESNMQQQKVRCGQCQQTKENKIDEKTGFCDLVIIKHLQDTLQLYESDLQILQQNKQNYEQQICFLAQKIKKLPQIQEEYHNLLLQKQQLNYKLIQQIQQYHSTNKHLFKHKLQIQKIFNQYKQKIRNFLLFKSFNDYNSKIYQNQELISFVDELENYYEDLQTNLQKIKAKILINNKNQDEHKNQQINVITTIFGNQCPYMTRFKSFLVQSKKQQKSKEDPVVSLDQTTTNKTKKLSQAEKALLLGDLKNFSKNFKLPPK